MTAKSFNRTNAGLGVPLHCGRSCAPTHAVEFRPARALSHRYALKKAALLTVPRAPAPAEAIAAVRRRGPRSRTRFARTLQSAAVGTGLRARLAAREREPNDGAVH